MDELRHRRRRQHMLRNVIVALALMGADDRSRPHSVAKAQAVPGGTDYYTHAVGGCSNPPVTVQYIVGQCLKLPGPYSVQYTTQNSPNALFVTLTQTTYKGGDCTTSPVVSTTQLYTDPWVCNKGGTQGNINGATTTNPNPTTMPPTAVYSVVSQYADQPTCSSSSGGYLQYIENTARTAVCHRWYPTRQNLVVNCVQAPMKGTQQVSLRPIFNFYDWSDTTCSQKVVRTVLGTAENNYQLSGCNITANSTMTIPMTAACPACLSANGCVYGNTASRRVASGLVTVLAVAVAAATLLLW